MDARPLNTLREVSSEVATQFSSGKHCFVRDFLKIIDGFLFHHGPIVADCIVNIHFNKADKISHIDLSTKHSKELFVVTCNWDVRLVVNAIIHLSGLFVVIDSPLVKHKLLKDEKQ